MKKCILFIAVFLKLSFYSASIAQDKQPYASDKPIPIPIIFEEGIISAPNVFGSAFTPDSRTFYFAKYDTAARRASIMKSTFENGKWLTPETAEFSGEYFEGDPSISPDGSKIFYWSVRPKNEKTKPAGAANLWVAEKTNDGFSNPVFLGDKLKISSGGAPCISSNGIMYFFTEQKGVTKKRDIYKADIFNPDSVHVVPLGEEINSDSNDYDSYIAPDEAYIIFTSERAGGFGKGDLYISCNNNGIWSKPVNLGNKINSPSYEYCPLVSPDGKYFFFTSDKSGKSQIYLVDISALPACLK
jgi:Tol biopolymer transport system component